MQRALFIVALAAIVLTVSGVLEPRSLHAGKVIRRADGSKWTLLEPNQQQPGMWWVQTGSTPSGPVVFSIDEEDLSADALAERGL